jgi:hypothetical protein
VAASSHGPATGVHHEADQEAVENDSHDGVTSQSQPSVPTITTQ